MHVDFDPDASELPSDLTRDVWVTGKFDGYHTYLSASERSVYTELNLTVQHVFGKPIIPGLKPDAAVVIGIPGGTIVAPWSGSAFSYFLHPHAHDFQPDHIYLIALQYVTSGNFYTSGPLLGEAHNRWDLTDGTVRPDSFLREHSAKHKPEIIGLKAPDVIQLLDKKFSQRYSDKR